MDFTLKAEYTIEDLLKIIELLRDPQKGCPWDKVQTHESIRMNFIEETYEVADAIDRKDMDGLCEELGDVLLQVALHAQMERETGTFDFDRVCDGICKKLIYRHPHIFGEVQADTEEQVLNNWDKLKKKEKNISTASENLRAVPAVFPALLRSKKVQKRADEYGFAYHSVQDALADLESEVAELKEAAASGLKAREELGDVLFSAVNVGRLLKIDSEEALAASCEKFIARVEGCEAAAEGQNKKLEELSAEELDKAWKQVKEGSAGDTL